MNGDKERGLWHMGIWGVSILAFSKIFLKNIDAVIMKNGKERGFIEVAKSFFNKQGRNENCKNFMKGLSKNKKILAVAMIASTYVNSIISAIDAFNVGKKN